MIRHLIILSAVIILFGSCRDNTIAGKTSREEDISYVYDVTHLNIISYGEIKKVVITDPWQNVTGKAFTYYLVPSHISLPDTLPDEEVIRVPVKRIVCMSTTHVAMLKALKAENTIVGISGTDLVYDQEIRKKISDGEIPDVGYENNLDKELLVSLVPDVLMSYGVGAGSVDYFAKLREMGIRIILNADYLEQHPLSRLEWIRLFGILTGTGERADSLCSVIRKRYLDLADSIASSGMSRPKVLLGAPWEDVWYIPPSDSYAAALVKDAGGDYLFDDLIAPNAKPYSTEAVFSRAMEADFWLNPGAAISLGEIAGYDYRMAQLPPFRNKMIYNNNRRSVKGGGNDYWESAVVHPDLLLRDMASVLHPDFMPGHLPVYYIKLE